MITRLTRHRVVAVLFLLAALVCASVRVVLAQTETILHNFAGGVDGSYPYAGLVRDASGSLYGTTAYGGAADCGVVFKVTASGQEAILYSFSGRDGASPWAPLLLDAQGNLFGTTAFGGAFGYGTVFELTAAGGYKLLHSFNPKKGASPYGGLSQDANGNLYGTTAYGGTFRYGTVFKLAPSGKHQVLYNFTGGKDGASPYAGVVLDGKGSLFGTTTFGGAFALGTVFRISAAGKEKVLHSFRGSPDGASPYAGLLRDIHGSLYGTTLYGGMLVNGVLGGTLFEISSTGREKIVYDFCSYIYCPDGAYPYGGLVQDNSGNLYGATVSGGESPGGVAYEVTPSGTETVLYDVVDAPYGTLARDSAGNLYGTTLEGGSGTGCEGGCGTVFEVSP